MTIRTRFNSNLGRLEVAVLLAALLVSFLPGVAISEAPACVDQQIAFDGIKPLHFATVIPSQGSKVFLYAENPASHKITKNSSRQNVFYVTAGDSVAIGKTCGSWAYVQYIGKDRVTEGWIDSELLQAKLPSASDKQSGDLLDDVAGNVRFKMKNGRGTPVCEAYLQRLNMTRYTDPPYCRWGQTLTNIVPGFSPIERVSLTAQDLLPVIGHTYDFLFEQQIDWKKEGRRVHDASGRVTDDPEYHLSSVQILLDPSSSYIPGYHLKAWRYQPDVDMENNGKPETIMIWQGDVIGKTTCYGGWSPYNSTLSRAQQYAFVMKAGVSDIDDVRTRALFGHPYGNLLGHSFRPVGDTMEIFKYQDAYYFDTFLDDKGDFENKRKGTALYKVLGVFQRRDNKARQMCEYVVDDE